MPRINFVMLAGLVLATPFASAFAADPAYLGTWKIAAAVVAPWADPATRALDKAEPQGLLGKILVFKPGEIAGPQPFACKKPHYKLKAYKADMVFQGAFGEMQAKNKSADPQKIAASLGLPAAGIETLETGCEIDFHFAASDNAKAGLNDYVYTLKKQ